jgi:MFS family permease
VSGLEWTVNAYTLSFAVLLLTGSALGDRFGRRRMFTTGVAVFTAGSAAAALAPTIGMLVAARGLQGAGGALMMPLTLTMLSAVTPPERRGAVLGAWGGIGGLGAALGPLVGGALTGSVGWRAIFWLNVPVGLTLMALSRLRLTETRGPRGKLDLAGVVLGATPLQAGLRMLPAAVMPMLLAPAGGVIADRIGFRPLLICALAMEAVALGWLAAAVTPTVPYGFLVPPLVLAGTGSAVFFAPVAAAMLSTVAPEEHGQASGAATAIRELAAVFGVAVLGLVFAGHGGYASRADFVAGFVPAMWLAAALAAVGVLAAVALPRNAARPHEPAGHPATPSVACLDTS